MVCSALYLPFTALAQDEETEPEPVPTDNITLETEFPKLEAVAVGSFQFNVTLNYKGQIERVFDFKTSAPAGWDVYIQPQYETGKRISSITIDSSYSGTSKSITAVVNTPSYPPPDPDEYKILLEVVSGEVSGSIELTAKITAKYTLSAFPLHELYNMSATSGKDNIYSIQVTNSGSAPIENITFDSTHPEGWEITFAPEKLETLDTSNPRAIDVNISPPPKAVAGDYMITLRVSGKQASADKMDIRVTVETPTIWGWVGVIIIIVVVAGLFVVFMRFGRR